MKRLKMSVFGIFLVVGSVFLLSGCSNSPEAKLADLFEEDQVYYLSGSPIKDPIITMEKSSDGKIIASKIDAGISEEMTYSVKNKEKGLYQYHIVNNEGKSVFEVSNFASDTTDFNVFYDEEHEGYAFVPVSKNYSKTDSTLKEVKDIYEDDPHYFVSIYQEK
ncbi:hypothetical protein ABE901_16705 [Enterococcus casseliflavus]|uniref:hypothetical protein n=1 Tax=Enterococcus TaxID=1350 RepID=UPI003D6C3F01